MRLSKTELRTYEPPVIVAQKHEKVKYHYLCGQKDVAEVVSGDRHRYIILDYISMLRLHASRVQPYRDPHYAKVGTFAISLIAKVSNE